ncbi:SGNH/GDSL hydrolase family protein [Maribacter sp. HTCC2170]|uniref:SGNH/GDSL hydrolase family protein n=1 Tax=Maribacter sp. (strain HTCC2170 / KCCM 42371) TaxID=313603 RepID=UPI00006B215B|nr:SGNH/GDSL hydrolase family protein [Maribacter sp. HTCC2170]EAR00160.1 putative secreted protein [Maribacter sp. HTCC2170]
MKLTGAYYSILFLFITCFYGQAQKQNRFQGEVEAIQKKYDTLWNPSKETIVFTGSSSIRLWKELNDLFPDHQIVNTGFGASLSTDLLHYCKELVINFNPYRVFIYEGDNDLASKRKPKEILTTTKEIVSNIWMNNNKTQIILISAKPSITRWSLKRKYKRLNRKFKRLAKKEELIQFVDVWSPMLEGKKINQELFLEDGLHMNARGYEIWYPLIKPFVLN